MPASLIRSRTMVTRVLDRHGWEDIADAAVLQEVGTITAIIATHGTGDTAPHRDRGDSGGFTRGGQTPDLQCDGFSARHGRSAAGPANR